MATIILGRLCIHPSEYNGSIFASTIRELTLSIHLSHSGVDNWHSRFTSLPSLQMFFISFPFHIGILFQIWASHRNSWERRKHVCIEITPSCRVVRLMVQCVRVDQIVFFKTHQLLVPTFRLRRRVQLAPFAFPSAVVFRECMRVQRQLPTLSKDLRPDEW